MSTIHEDTKRELIQNGTGVVGSLLKELLVHRNQIDVMETKKEKEIELAKAKANAQRAEQADHDHQPDPRAQPDPEPQQHAEGGISQATPAQVEEALDELIEEEMCSVCRDLLVDLKKRPTKEQIRGIMEYGTFKRELGDGADVEELKALLAETEILQSVFQEKFNGAGGDR